MTFVFVLAILETYILLYVLTNSKFLLYTSYRLFCVRCFIAKCSFRVDKVVVKTYLLICCRPMLISVANSALFMDNKQDAWPTDFPDC